MNYPIKNRTAFITMIAFGALLVGIGIFLTGYDIAGILIPYVGIVAVIIGISEIGLKRLTKISSLKKLNNMQIVSLVIYAFVFITSILKLFDITIPVISNFLAGSIIVIGIFIIIEAIR